MPRNEVHPYLPIGAAYVIGKAQALSIIVAELPNHLTKRPFVTWFAIHDHAVHIEDNCFQRVGGVACRVSSGLSCRHSTSLPLLDFALAKPEQPFKLLLVYWHDRQPRFRYQGHLLQNSISLN